MKPKKFWGAIVVLDLVIQTKVQYVDFQEDFLNEISYLCFLGQIAMEEIEEPFMDQ